MAAPLRAVFFGLIIVSAATNHPGPRPPPSVLSRRAWACLASLSTTLGPRDAHARERAQNAPSLFGIVSWGGRERCDPTEVACGRDGVQPSAGVAMTVPEPRAAITDRVFLEYQVNRVPAGRLSIGLYGTAAPLSTLAFRELCAGTLTSRPGERPASYAHSSVVRIEQGRALYGGELTLAGGLTELGLGSARPIFRRVEPVANAEQGSGDLSVAGLLAMRRGGQSVDYAITLGDARRLLGEDWVAIGQVLDAASLELLGRVSALPVNKYDGRPLVRIEVENAGI